MPGEQILMFNEINIRPNDVIKLNFNYDYSDLESSQTWLKLFQTAFPNNAVIADCDVHISSIDIFHMEQADELLSLDKDRIF